MASLDFPLPGQGFVSPFSSPFPVRSGPATRLALGFLFGTVLLSVWLGFQAVLTARSHRRTAEGVLRDYARIAVSEFARRLEERLGRMVWDLFEDVPPRVRSDPPPGPEVVARELGSALRRAGCRCGEMRRRGVYLALDVATDEVRVLPDSFPVSLARRAAAAAKARWDGNPSERIAFFSASPGEILEEGAFLAFNVSLQARGRGAAEARAVYVFLAPLGALEELIGVTYREVPLLPEAVAGPVPNDSLVHLSVLTPSGDVAYSSPAQVVPALLVRDTLSRESGNFVVEGGIHARAASSLVIGGLPKTRLPLLIALMVLAVGVGGAAILQLRREGELARLREEFVSGVSHEFRTPLAQIRMFGELLADGKLASEEDRIRAMGVVKREAVRLSHLVENILQFSALSRGMLYLGPREGLQFSSLVGEVLEAFAPLAEARRTSLAAEVKPPELKGWGHRQPLYRILANLVDNALKYGPEEQTVRLEVHDAGNGKVRLWVEDEGAGIPPAAREKVWKPFHRLQRDADRRQPGTGVGLAVVRELARAMGGRAWVEGGEKGGARVVVEVPWEWAELGERGPGAEVDARRDEGMTPPMKGEDEEASGEVGRSSASPPSGREV